MSFVQKYHGEAVEVMGRLDPKAIDAVADLLAETRARGGRLFVLGVGPIEEHVSPTLPGEQAGVQAAVACGTGTTDGVNVEPVAYV